MIQAAAFVRAVAKITLWLFVALLSSAVLWFAANRLLDESPDPSREGFLVSSQDLIPNERNIAVGILGLTAPEGLDFVQYGSRVKALYASNAPQGEIQEMVRGPKTLRPTVDSDQVTCWLDPGDPIFKEWKNCLPFEQAPNVLEQNKELLKRYKALYRLGSYSSLDIYYNNAYFTVPKLLAAEMHLSLRGRSYGVAYRKWRDQMVFVKGKLRGPDTWVGKAIGLVDFGMAFSFLEPLLVANPQVAKVHFAELSEILRPEGMDAFNPEGIVRAEYSILKKSLQFPPQENPERPVDRLHWLTFHLGQPNRILNRYYAFAREYT